VLRHSEVVVFPLLPELEMIGVLAKEVLEDVIEKAQRHLQRLSVGLLEPRVMLLQIHQHVLRIHVVQRELLSVFVGNLVLVGFSKEAFVHEPAATKAVLQSDLLLLVRI